MPPDELDPAFSIYETPTEGMKRIERAMRPVQDGKMVSPAGVSRQGNYSAGIGVQGPLSGMLMASSKPYTGEPGAVIARGEMGPVSYQAVQPLVRGAPMSHTVGVGGRPFNADAYFGVNATRSPGGTQYGAEIRSGGFGAQGQYDPTTKGYSVGAGYQTNFAQGGRASVGHTSAAGQPVTLENHKGETRHRQDSGNSRMAADYGYLDQSRPDHDGMKTDAFVGPHHDSKKIFVINQQHPRTGKFNEHKVLLGYKDRAHAVRDYVHSFSDGLGHKRIHSIVEMGTHELKDWLKKPHTAPLKKAGGGPVNKADDPRQWLQFGGQDMETAPAGLPIGQALGTDVAYQTAEGLVDAAKLVQEVQAGEVDPTSDEGIKRAFGAAMVAQTGGIGGAPARAGETVLGSGLVRKTAEREMSPVGLYSHGAEAASTLPQAKGAPQQMVASMRQAGVKPDELFAAGIADEAATNALRQKIAEEFTPKIEAARVKMEGLEPGTKEFQQAERQFKNLQSTMRAQSDNALALTEDWASRPSVTRDELAQHFRESMPVVEERVLGTRTKGQPYPEKYIKIEQDIMDRYRDELNRLNSIHMDYDQPRSVRDDAFKKYNNLINKRDFEIDDAIPNREELIQAARDTVVPTKFGSYTLPGGENYREVLLKAQVKGDEAAALNKISQDMYGKNYTDLMGDTSDLAKMRLAVKREYKNQYGQSGLSAEDAAMFRSSHWDDPNVLAHLRMSDRTGPNGEKILHVEEVQSDWGQKGKKEGFRNPNDNMQNLVKEYDYLTKQRRALEVTVRNGDDADPATQAAISRLTEVNNAMSALSDRMTAVRSNIPSAPYVTSTQGWTDLALKRALKEAAEGGYDKLVWTPGAEQAKRYDLSKQVKNVYYDPDLQGGTLAAEGLSGQTVLDKSGIKPENIAEYIGKEAAEKLLAQERNVNGHHVLEGDGLKIGGEGMKAYYDKILPNRLQELARKHDKSAKIEMGRLPVQNYTISVPDIARELKMSVEEIAALPHDEKMALINTVRHSIAAPGITITPAMRESILKGQTAFAEGGAVEAEPDVVEDANYAQGGPVAPAPQSFDLEPKDEGGGKLSNLVSSISHKAHERGLHQRKLSSVIKQATGAPAEWAYGLAGHLLRNNDTFLSEHARKYPKFPEVIQAIDEAI